MANFHDRYRHDFYQEVYDDLMALGELVFDDGVVEDAHAVATHLMKRVRYNLEIVLIPRLQEIGYRFGDGSWDHRDMLFDDKLKQVQLAEPILQVPPPETAAHFARLREVCGSLPLSLTAWYTEVGAVNLIGAFAAPYPSNAGCFQSTSAGGWRRSAAHLRLWLSFPNRAVSSAICSACCCTMACNLTTSARNWAISSSRLIF